MASQIKAVGFGEAMDAVRDPLASPAALAASRARPMSERLEVALSWNAVAAELRATLDAPAGRRRARA